MENDDKTNPAAGADTLPKEYYSVRLTVSGTAQDYEDSRAAGAAFFRADPAERPTVTHVDGDTARIMARTTMAGTDETGAPRYGKSLPDSHTPDVAFRAGFHEAMEVSLAEREAEAERDGRAAFKATHEARPNVIATAPWVRTDLDVELRGVAVKTEKGIHTGYEAARDGGEAVVSYSEATFPNAQAALRRSFDFYEGDEKGLETALRQRLDEERETDGERRPAPTMLSIQHQERPEFARPETAIYAGQEAQLIVTLGHDAPATRALADALVADPEFRAIVAKHVPDAESTLGRGRFTDGQMLPSPEALIVAEANGEGPALASFPDESPLSLELARHLTKSPAVVAYADAQRESPALPRTRAELQTHVEYWIERVGGQIRALSPAAQAELRPEFNDLAARAMEVLGDKRQAELLREPPTSALYRSALAAETPVLDGAPEPMSAAQTDRLGEGLSREADTAGLDGRAVAKRLETGASNALEERAWVMADVAKVAAKNGLDPRQDFDWLAAATIVDRFYEKAGEMIAEARGVKVENAAGELRDTLGAMVRMDGREGRVRFESEADAKGLVDDMKARYGENIVKELAEGKTDALAKDFSDVGQRVKIADAVTSAARDNGAFGLSPKEAEQAHDGLTKRRVEERTDERETSRDRER